MKRILASAIVFSFAASCFAAELKTETYSASLPAGWVVSDDLISATETAHDEDGCMSVTILTVSGRGKNEQKQVRQMLVGYVAGMAGWKIAGEPQPAKIGKLDGFKIAGADINGPGKITIFIASDAGNIYSIHFVSFLNVPEAESSMNTIVDSFRPVLPTKSGAAADGAARFGGHDAQWLDYLGGGALAALLFGFFFWRKWRDRA